MKVLKIVLIAVITVGLLIVLPLIVALFIGNDYSSKKEIIIDKPVNEVFDYVKKLRNQDEFSVRQLLDTGIKKKFTGIDGTVGFIYAWESDIFESGTGEKEIKKIDENNRMDYESRLKEPWKLTAQSYFITQSIAENENQTKVIWGSNGRINYPTNILLLFWDSDVIIGNDLAKSLANLKKILEEQHSSQ